jgi:hypothetical protein
MRACCLLSATEPLRRFAPFTLSFYSPGQRNSLIDTAWVHTSHQILPHIPLLSSIFLEVLVSFATDFEGHS